MSLGPSPIFVEGITAAVAAVIAVGLGWAVLRSRPTWRAIAAILAMPVPWLLIWAWAEANRVEAGFRRAAEWPDGLGLAVVAVTLAISAWAIHEAEGARWPVGILALMNFAFALLTLLLAVMKITGLWM